MPGGDSGPTQHSVRELKVSGHLMTLGPGVFCVYHAPGAPGPDAATGLPGVRVSLPPRSEANGARVQISGFRDDGWLGDGDGAALIRITGGAAQILVTIYQQANSSQAAPKLQILRLSDPPLPQPDPEPAEIAAHIHRQGDVTVRLGEWVGQQGSQRWIEGFAIAPRALIAPGDIEYQAVLGRNWLSPWVEGPGFCGSRGMALPILGLRVRLRGEGAASQVIALQATFVDGSAAGPVGEGPGGNGAVCQAESLAPLEAFRITLRSRPEAASPRKGVRRTQARS